MASGSSVGDRPGARTDSGINRHEKGDEVAVDHDLASVLPEQFEALVLPGGVANPDTLRTNPQAVSFVKHFATKNKRIAAICHGRGP